MAAPVRVASYACRECRRAKIAYEPTDEAARRLAARGLCRACAFWSALVSTRRYNDSVRIGGILYLIGEEPLVVPLGAVRHRIGFTDERPRAKPEVVTHNLELQGRIPGHFRSRLPDNARFL